MRNYRLSNIAVRHLPDICSSSSTWSPNDPNPSKHRTDRRPFRTSDGEYVGPLAHFAAPARDVPPSVVTKGVCSQGVERPRREVVGYRD